MRSFIKFLLLLIFGNIVYATILFRSGRRNNLNRGAHAEDDTGETRTEWFSQKLDHTNPSDLRTWNQVSTMILPYNVLVTVFFLLLFELFHFK